MPPAEFHVLRDDDPAVVGAPDALGRPAMIGMVTALPRAAADVVSELMRGLRRFRQRRDALGVAGPAELVTLKMPPLCRGPAHRRGVVMASG